MKMFNDQTRKSDLIQEGIYFFGGKNQKGNLINKLRYMKPEVVEKRVIHSEFLPLKQGGLPPCPRFGHTMCYLPVNRSLCVAGGRNDTLQKESNTPFLDDIHLFLLDQKVWLQVRYSQESDKLDNVTSHCMSLITDGE